MRVGLTTEDTESTKEEDKFPSHSVFSVLSVVNFSESIFRKGDGAFGGGSGAEFFDDGGEDFGGAGDFLGGREAAEGEAEGGFRAGVGEAHRFEDMGRFPRTGGAGGTGGATDAALVEEDEGSFALDAFEGEIGGVWEAIGTVAVDGATRNRVEEGAFEAVAERGLERMGGGEFGGFSEGDDRGDILRAAAAAVFLSAAQERGEGNAAVDVEGTDTFRRMDFVS